MEQNTLRHERLTDIAKLEEIGKLRCLAWEMSKHPNHISFKNYPNGFIEPIDKRATHYYTLNSNNEIVAAIRFSIINDVNELVHPEFYTTLENMPAERPFMHVSRLVIHPDYRKMGIKQAYRKFATDFLIDNGLAFSLSTVASYTAKTELTETGHKSIAFIPKGTMPEPYDQEVVILELKDIKIPAEAF